MLLDARLTGPKDKDAVDLNLIGPRIKVGVLLTAPGNGGDNLSAFAAAHYSSLNPDYGYLTTQTLVVFGDNDQSPHLTIRGANWFIGAHYCASGSDCLPTLFNGKHRLGGIARYDAKETDDQSPDRLAVTQRMTSAYLQSALYPGDASRDEASKALQEQASSLGRVDRT